MLTYLHFKIVHLRHPLFSVTAQQSAGVYLALAERELGILEPDDPFHPVE